ncbi:MAG TPA: tetratricopeptide repeat protein [Methylomirabilota bacterium]|nr:tetratricopeptide repeat protein [Methylomirabilota bacterium]
MSLKMFEELGDKRGMGQSLHVLGMQELQFEVGTARSLIERSAALYREAGEKWWLALADFGLGNAANLQGNHEQADRFFSESLAIFQQFGDRWGLARPLRGLGWVASQKGDYDHARTLLEQSLGIRREMRDKVGIALVLADLAEVMREQARARGSVGRLGRTRS